MTDVEEMLAARMTKTEYLAKWKPANTDFDITDESAVEAAIIDFEGWVGMKIASLPHNDVDYAQVEAAVPKCPLTIYSKIKTVAFYKAHKFHFKNIPYLITLSRTAAHIFPLAGKVASLLGPGMLIKQLKVAQAGLMQLLDTRTGSPLLRMAAAAYSARVERAEASGDKVPKNPLNGMERRPFHVQCKMLLNMRGLNLGPQLTSIYGRAFPELDVELPGLDRILLGVTMKLQPWDADGFDARAAALDPCSGPIQGLVFAILGRSLV